jgi:hypothetical protein
MKIMENTITNSYIIILNEPGGSIIEHPNFYFWNLNKFFKDLFELKVLFNMGYVFELFSELNIWVIVKSCLCTVCWCIFLPV